MIHYYRTETEIKKILQTLIILIDTRENVNHHITRYFDQKGIRYRTKKIDTGDYSAVIPKNDELGIHRDIYLNSCVERKSGIDEITGNLLKDKRTAFENELIRSSKHPFVLLVEDADGYGKILRGEYRSKYNPMSLLGTLNTFKARYNFEIVYLNKKYTGNFLYWHFLYQAKEYLKQGSI